MQRAKSVHGHDDAALMRKVAKLSGESFRNIVEMALLLREVLWSKDTPNWTRALIASSCLYLACPGGPPPLCFIDPIPDALGMMADDAAVLTAVLVKVNHLITDEMRDRVRRRMEARQHRHNTNT